MSPWTQVDCGILSLTVFGSSSCTSGFQGRWDRTYEHLFQMFGPQNPRAPGPSSRHARQTPYLPWHANVHSNPRDSRIHRTSGLVRLDLDSWCLYIYI